MWVEVTFLGTVPSAYIYHVPFLMEDRMEEGCLAVAPLRRRRLPGVVTRVLKKAPLDIAPASLKPVLCLPFRERLFHEHHLELYRWCANYYRLPLGGILKSALPLPAGAMKGERIVLTKTGRAVLEREKGKGNPCAKELLNQWNEGKALSTLISHEGMWKALLEWTDKGWLVWEYKGFEKVFEPKISFLKVSPTFSGGRLLGSKQREIFEYVCREGIVEERELKRVIPHAHIALKRLVEKGILKVTYRAEDLWNGKNHIKKEEPPRLSPEQRVAIELIERESEKSSPHPILIHGVTGSGKTELYIRSIRRVTKTGKSVLVLVPEIVLTSQLISRIRSRCDAPVVVWHSHLTEREKWHQWLLLVKNAPVVVIGARSSIFVPLRNLGLIVVDEEHDPSFKQGEGILYNARDLAIVRARMQSCVLLLGSATPSIESYHNVKRGRFKYAAMVHRPTGQPLPSVETVDMRKTLSSLPQALSQMMLSSPLRKALMETYEKGHQALLFLNRRGFARVVVCSNCGEALMCPRCSVSLVLHKPHDILRCHYCGFHRKLPPRCERCGGAFLQIGAGTQRLELEVQQLIPQARIARLDRDIMQKRSLYEDLLGRLRAKEIDILIGTQMVVKGHDYPGIALVGIVMADHSLRFPDFRSAERTFQLLTQASGRCGRGKTRGQVIIQTFSPDHYSIRYAKYHDFLGFYEEEIRYRKELAYPPFARLAVIRVVGEKVQEVKNRAAQIVEVARDVEKRVAEEVEILGPAPALLSRLKDRHRWHIILKSSRSRELHQFITRIFSHTPLLKGRSINVRVEFDPIQLV